MYKQTISATEDQSYFRGLVTAVRKTRAGKCAIKLITRNNIPVLFFDAKTGFAGDYSPYPKRIRIRKNSGLEQMGFVHEARRARQYLMFPELFPRRGDLNVVDFYVSSKLKEFDAYLGAVEHVAPVQKILKQAWGMRGELESNHGLSKQEYDSAIAAYWMQKQIDLVFEQMSRGFWPSHEHIIFHDEPILLSVIQSEQFEQRVATSSFLAPEFLIEFCCDWEGQSYLPSNQNHFIDTLTQSISTIHHPRIASLAESLRRSNSDGEWSSRLVKEMADVAELLTKPYAREDAMETTPTALEAKRPKVRTQKHRGGRPRHCASGE